MYILPYFHKTLNNTTQIYWFFLTEGGKSLWKTDEENPSTEFILHEYLKPNGFYGTVKGVKENCLFYCVDSPKFEDFYLWTDKEAIDKECWRPFFLVGDSDDWGWMEESEHFNLGISLKTLFCTLEEKKTSHK